jgi:Peptidase A4 family
MQVRQCRARLLAAVTVAAVAGSVALASAPGASAQALHSYPAPGGRMIRSHMPPGVVNASVAGAIQIGSTNWSGYAQNAASNGTFTAVHDTWRVPTVNTTLSGNQYASDWVGVDGFSNASLVQCGTEADNIGHKAVYYAWTEILPAPEVVITGLAIHAGDKIFAQVKETKANTWLMQVKDLTTGKSGSKTVSYTTPETSAEVIHERPAVNGSLATLAKTSKVTQDPGSYSTSAPGTTTSYHPLMSPASAATVYQIFMVNNAGTKIIAAPSAPDSDRDGFAVAYGATSPAPPSS